VEYDVFHKEFDFSRLFPFLLIKNMLQHMAAWLQLLAVI
jgi:hypothetical protein